MTIDAARLRALAEAATPGPWEADGNEVSQHWSRPEPWRTVASSEVACMSYCYGRSGRGIENEADAAYIAAADPPTMLALLDRLEAAETLRSMADAYRAKVEQERDRLISALGRIHGYVQGAARRALPEEYAEWEKAAALAEEDGDA